MRISTDSPADGNELSNVEAAFAQFELRYKGLALSETPAEFDLRDTGIFASLHEQFDNSPVEVGMN